MLVMEDEEWLRYSAIGFRQDYSIESKRYLVRLDWMLALGRSALDRGDLRIAMKYFNMVLDIDSRNFMANYYLKITKKLIARKKLRAMQDMGINYDPTEETVTRQNLQQYAKEHAVG